MGKPPSRAADVAGALTAIKKAKAIGRGRKSPIFLWFWDRYDTLAAEFEKNAPSWKALADYLGEHGVVDGHGNPPSPGATENAWWRVKRDKARAKEPGAAAQKSEPVSAEERSSVTPAPVSAQKPPASPATSPLGPLPEKPRFKFVPSTPVQPKKPEGEE